MDVEGVGGGGGGGGDMQQRETYVIVLWGKGGESGWRWRRKEERGQKMSKLRGEDNKK